MAQIRIGISGWRYKPWRGVFYPEQLAQHLELWYASRVLPAIEINGSFYSLQRPEYYAQWHDATPEHFVFSVKGPRFITHLKRLRDVGVPLANFFASGIFNLRHKLGPILWQLPPNFLQNTARLETFLAALPRQYRYAVEFRHPSWLDSEVFDVLRRYNAAYVPVSSEAMPMNLTITTDFTYIRFHGLAHGAAHDYATAELQPWAEFVRDVLRRGMAVFAYFNNDINVRAPKNAREFRSMFT